MRQIESRVLQLTGKARTVNTEAGIAGVFHNSTIESHAVHTPLIKIEHVLTITFAIGDDFQAKTGLVFGGPADVFVHFLLGPTGPLHGVGDLLRARVASDDGIAKWFAHVCTLILFCGFKQRPLTPSSANPGTPKLVLAQPVFLHRQTPSGPLSTNRCGPIRLLGYLLDATFESLADSWEYRPHNSF